MKRFEGRTALVTGASGGLGAAIALALGREGAFVALGCHTSPAGAEATLAKLREAGGDGIVLAFDIGAAAEVEQAVDHCVSLRGGIDLAFANAGIAADGWFLTQGAEAMELGTAHVCRSVARVMARQRRGSLVTVASVAGLGSSPGQSFYAASKGGIIALTKTLASELARFGVRVNCLVPGLVASGLGARLDRRHRAETEARIPLRRLGEAEEIAPAALFLASDDASYVVGHTLVVDGGLVA
jgi:3-oxoacyl-[acyl-carrier protein] reductase